MAKRRFESTGPPFAQLSPTPHTCMMLWTLVDKKGDVTMKNPLDSLGQTIVLGLVLTVVVILLIHAIA